MMIDFTVGLAFVDRTAGGLPLQPDACRTVPTLFTFQPRAGPLL